MLAHTKTVWGLAWWELLGATLTGPQNLLVCMKTEPVMGCGGMQHPLVHMGNGAGVGTDQAAASMGMYISWYRKWTELDFALAGARKNQV